MAAVLRLHGRQAFLPPKPAHAPRWRRLKRRRAALVGLAVVGCCSSCSPRFRSRGSLPQTRSPSWGAIRKRPASSTGFGNLTRSGRDVFSRASSFWREHNCASLLLRRVWFGVESL